MGTVIGQKVVDTTKTTCIEITAESYKCIDISAYVPTCIMITSNVPTSEHYEKPRADLLITEAPQLQIALINNATPVLNVNMDADGVYYVTDFDTVYIDITNWNANAEYVNIFSDDDGNAAVIFLDEVEQRIVWALDDYALDGTQMWLYAQAKESDKLISPQSSVTVTQMEQTDQPNLSSWVSQTEQTVLNITILDYDATYTYADPIVTGGTAVRTDNIIAWTLPNVAADTYHEISITATAPLMYESLAGVSGGIVIGFCNISQITFFGLVNNIVPDVGVTHSSHHKEGLWVWGAATPLGTLYADFPCWQSQNVELTDGEWIYIRGWVELTGEVKAQVHATPGLGLDPSLFTAFNESPPTSFQAIADAFETTYGIHLVKYPYVP